MPRLSETCQSLRVLVEERAKRPQEVWGLPSGFPEWDRLTGGFQRGEVTVIGARTGVGKSSLAGQLALQALQARPDELVILVSPEMSQEGLVVRLASCLSRVPSREILTGQAGPEARRRFIAALETLESFEDRLILWAGGKVKLVDLELRLTELSQRRPIALVLIDYLNLIEAGGSSPYERATEVSRGVRAIATSLNIPIVLFSQLSRPSDRSEEKAPTLFELRDSGNIEQDADNVLLLWRPPLEEGNGRRSQVTVCHLAKQRNGPTGIFRLYFLEDVHRFESWK